jgi:putative SOS response-associated peptidase YedK
VCSRYSLTTPPEAVRQLFGLAHVAPYPPRMNIAPTQPTGVVRLDLKGQRVFELVRWGLIPSWVKDPKSLSTLLNARAETVLEKPSFKGNMRHRRCIVPASGFYEWVGPPRAKRPFLIQPRDQNGKVHCLGFAGLWDHWLGADGSEIETMAIVTVAANATVSAVHDRMPAILSPHQFDDWLDVKRVDAADAARFLVPAPEDLLELFEVSAKLNSVHNEGPEVQARVRTTLL